MAGRMAVLGALLAAALAGCSDVRMGDEPRNYRESLPGPGLLTGAEGKWVVTP